MLQQSASGARKGRKGQSLLGKPVCQTGFRRLLGLGPRRFSQLKAAVAKGSGPPVDGRRRPRALDGTNVESLRKRSLIVEFLEDIYHTLSEPMPELSAKTKAESSERPLKGLRFRRTRGKRPGKQFRKQQLEKPDDAPMRMLPPGSFTDYLRMLNAKYPGEKFSLKLFNLVPWLCYDIVFFFTKNGYSCPTIDSLSLIVRLVCNTDARFGANLFPIM